MGPRTVQVVKSGSAAVIDIAAEAVARYTTFRDGFADFIKTHPTAVSSVFQVIINNSPSIVPQVQTEMVKQFTGIEDNLDITLNPIGVHNIEMVGIVEN